MIRGVFLSVNKSEIYDKPFQTYDQLLINLESKNIIIDNRELALRTLSNQSYYGIVNGYKNMFPTDTSGDKFTIPVKFTDLYAVQLIDANLSSVILKYILYIEKSLKSKISYIVAQNYGVFTDETDLNNLDIDDYLNETHYSRSTGRRKAVTRRLKEDITKHPTATIKHYIKTKNHLPPWIITTNIPFGDMIQWYSILLDDDKTYVTEQFVRNSSINIEDKKEFLRKAFDLLKEYRNTYAHGNRTFNATMSSFLPKRQTLILFNGIISEEEYTSGRGKNDIFSVILILIELLNDNYLISNLIYDLGLIFSPYDNSKIAGKSILETFTLPDDLFDRLPQAARIIN